MSSPLPSAMLLAPKDPRDKDATSAVLGMIVAFLWLLLGFTGIVYSLTCPSKSGPFKMHVLGIVIAVLLGPFYWIFFAYNKDYCR